MNTTLNFNDFNDFNGSNDMNDPTRLVGEELLVKYLDGTLSGEEQTHVRSLAAAYPTLAAELKEMRGFDDFLETANQIGRAHV